MGGPGIRSPGGTFDKHTLIILGNSPVPVQFDWDKIRTEMKPIKMARTKAQHELKKSPKKTIRSNWKYFGLKLKF